MAQGVTTQGPSLRPCIPGLRFVSNPMLRRAAASSPNLHSFNFRQLSSVESGSWRHESSGESHTGGRHKNSSKLSAKSLVNPRTRKWSVSSKHHLLSGHARDTSNSRESFVANGYPQADGLQRRPIPSPNRGHSVSLTDDTDFSGYKIPYFDGARNYMYMVPKMGSSNLGPRGSSPNYNQASRSQNDTKYSTPQKEASDRQEYSAKGHHVTPSHTSHDRKMSSYNPLYNKMNFHKQHRMEEKDGVGSISRISPTHLENDCLKGHSIYNGQKLKTSRSQTHLTRNRRPYERLPPQGLNMTRNRRPYERLPPQGLNSYEIAQKNVVALKLDRKAWQEETKIINAMRSHAEASIGSGRTDCQPMLSDMNPASGTKEVLSTSNQRRDTMPMITLAALDGRDPMQKPDHASVEEHVPVEGSITTKTRSQQVGLLNPGLIISAQDQGLQHSEIPKISSSRQETPLEKVNCRSENVRTGHMSNVTGTGEVCGNHSMHFSEKTPLDQEDKKGRPLSLESGGGCSIDQVKKESPAAKGKLIGPDNGQDSAIIEVGTRVTDSKNNNLQEKLDHLYNKICIVDKVETAKMVVGKLMGEYRELIHACDTEVAGIDIKKESPVGHGKIICFSIYCGSEADFGDGKSCVWVDVLKGGDDVLSVFSPYFGDSSIQKVWHNYSFDKHIIENHKINVDGFHADTMHLARLWDSGRSREGGYSLEALTKDPKVMDKTGAKNEDELITGKESMKSIFGKKKIKKDGTEGKVITLAPVEELQRTERIPWICYSGLDAISTLNLWKSLKAKLELRDWIFEGVRKGNMYEFYTEYWRPFGNLLVQMESEGMLVDRNYLSEMEKVAVREQEISGSRFRKWASKYCQDACYMNVSSDAQVRQLLFGGIPNKKKPSERLPMERTFKVPNTDNIIEEGKKAPLKFRNIVLCGVGKSMEVEETTSSGWPAVSGAALKTLAGKVSVDYDSLQDDNDNELPADSEEDKPALTSMGVVVREDSVCSEEEIDPSIYGTAYRAFEGGENGREACHAITALCEVSSINTLISNFLQPLQGKQISGETGRVHCSLNINTETGRLSARKPNLQNQPALEKDRYKIRKAFIAEQGNSLIVADYGQLELRILAHLSKCKSMLDAFRAGGDFHSRTAMNMYPHVREAVEKGKVLLEWDPQPGEEKPSIPLLKDLFATERRKAKMLNFSIAYGKTAIGLSKDWKVSETEAMKTVKLWYNERQEVLRWQEKRKDEARNCQCVHTLLGRARHFPNLKSASSLLKGHIERAAINTPVQGSAADVAMCAMLEISRNSRLKELKWKLLLQVHDEVILEGPTESAEEAKSLVVQCMSKPFDGKNILLVDLAVDAKCALNWYEGK